MRKRTGLQGRFGWALLLTALAMAALTASAGASTAYVTNFNSNNLSLIDTQTNLVSPTTIPVGTNPSAIAITPDGRTAYVANYVSGSVSVIDVQTATAAAIGIGPIGPNDVAITPDGRTAYVVAELDNSFRAIGTQTNQVGPRILVGANPGGIAITPDGKTAYVTNFNSNNVSLIDTQTNLVSPTTIPVGANPNAVAITPDSKTAYVTNSGSDSVSVIDTQTKLASPMTIPVGDGPIAIAITPDGKTAYVANLGADTVSVIDTQTNVASPTTIPVGDHPTAIAISQDQAPRASFAATRARPGVPASFDGSASVDSDGSIVGSAWDFGDGQTLSGGLRVSHTYGAPGMYRARLSVTDDEGCSAAPVLPSGQRCNSSALASQIQTVEVAYPGVRLSCPKRAKPGGCKFKLQVVSKKREGRVQSALTSAKLRAGCSAIVSLKPKRLFVAKLAVAAKVLVKQTLTIDGIKRTRVRQLKIVQ